MGTMISTPDKATARDQLLTQLGEEASTKLRLATVRLTAGLFTGSGVILTTVIKGDRGVFVVATAAHNLWFYVDSLTGGTSRDFWGGDKGKWSAEVLSSKKQAIIDLCLARLNVEYASADMTQPNPTAAVTTATIGRVILAEFQYDLCLLLIPFPLRARPRCEIVA
ncbi:MAG TPA: hypothetical protein VFQ61_00070, partial [Polyangiaceae bacterium]|nr:hypothetical protein [Polyangiaceae bacterium]